MNINTIITVLSAAVVFFLLLGFAIGLSRGWKKSLIRFGCILGVLILSIFLTPVIAKTAVKSMVKGSVINVFGNKFDIEKLIGTLISDSNFIDDLFAAESTTNELVTAVINIIMNIASFLIIFISLSLIALLAYGITSLVLGVKIKKSEEEKPKKTWGNRFIGAGIGFVSMICICFAFMTPVFGVMNICDAFLKNTKPKTAASAIGPNNFIAGELFYKDDENIGQIEEYVEKYAKIKKTYEKSPAGFLFKYTGVNFLGKTTFNYLTTVESGDLKMNFTDELVTVIKTYNLYKYTFVQNKFDLSDNKCIDALIEIYDNANDSEIVKGYLTELLPKISERWNAGEKFLGIACPVDGDFKPVFTNILEIFITTNMNKINNNVVTILEAIKIANNNEFIKVIQDDGDITEFLKTNETMVQNVFLKLAETPEFKTNLPSILNDTIKIAYKTIIGEEGDFVEAQAPDNIDWNKEASILQGLTNKTLILVDNLEAGSDSKVMLDNLSEIGEVVDLARKSSMLSSPLQTFLKGFVNSDKFKLDGKIKTTVSDYIDSKWVSTNETEFKDLFAVVEDTAKVADQIATNVGNMDINGIKDALGTIVDNEDLKGVVSSMLTDNVIGEMLGEEHSETAEVVTNMLDTFLTHTNGNTIENDLKAGQEIINILNASKNNGNNLILDVPEDEKDDKAADVVNAITGSVAIKEMLKEATDETKNPEGTALSKITSSIGGDISYIKGYINNPESNIEESDRALLQKVFG